MAEKAEKKPVKAKVEKVEKTEKVEISASALKKAEVTIAFNDPKISKFVNYLMMHGKKTVAQKIFTDTMKEIQLNGHPNPQAVLETALENAAPDIMVKSKRI
jgi:ribosomal protein S7